MLGIVRIEEELRHELDGSPALEAVNPHAVRFRARLSASCHCSPLLQCFDVVREAVEVEEPSVVSAVGLSFWDWLTALVALCHFRLRCSRTMRRIRQRYHLTRSHWNILTPCEEQFDLLWHKKENTPYP